MEKRTNKGIKNHLKGIFTNKTVISALGITLFLLIMFRLGSSITVPGIDISGMKKDDSNSFASMLNLLAGGGLNRLSLFAVGVGPYITAQIIVQLLSTDLVKPMARMAKLGERGRRKLEVITRVLTLPFCIAQSYAVLALLLQNSDSGIKIFGQTSLSDISAGKIIALMTIFTAGTYICIFIGDIITKRGVGQGVTLLILAGIVANIVPNFTTSFQYIKGKMDVQSSNYIINLVLSEGLYILFFVGILFAVIFVNGATRKIPVQQTGQGLTNKVEDLPFLPIKLNSAGVIPVIFASSILTIPGTIAQFLGN
jgi:preprotein translocase subunit SecY